MTEILRLSLVEAYGIAYDALARNGFAHDHADAIARSVAASERDGCHSHGLYRVLVCVRTARSGMVELAARPHIEDISPALLRSLVEVTMAHFQSQRSLAGELQEAQQALQDRRVIDKAKYRLVQEMHMSEEEAYHQLRRMAMERGMKIAELARLLIERGAA